MEDTGVVIDEVTRLADAALMSELSRCVRMDRAVTARLLVHLGEVDARGLYRERAWSSMFAYAVKDLHMSEAEAGTRIAAARLCRRFPRVLTLLAEGAVHLTAVKLLGPHLTADNHVDVLERARRKTSREIECLVAELAPKPDVPSSIRKLPERVSARVTQDHAVNMALAPVLTACAQPEAAPQATTLASAARQQAVSSGAATMFTAAAQPGTAPQATMLASAARQQAVSSGASAMFTAAAQPGAAPQATMLASAAPQQAVSSGASAMFTAAAQPEAATLPEGTSSAAMPASGERVNSAGRLQPEHHAHARFALEPVPHKAAIVTPLRPGRYEVKLTVDEEMRGKLEQLQELLRHQIPNGDLAIILARATDLLLEKTRKARFAETSRPRANKPPASLGCARQATETATHTRAEGTRAAAETESRAAGSDGHARDSKLHDRDRSATDRTASRYVPRSVVREVYARDGRQCTFVSAEGRRCPERGFLELHHHAIPYARGGAATADNLRTVCRSHNALYAERDLGRAFMRSKLAHARSPESVEPNARVLRRPHT